MQTTQPFQTTHLRILRSLYDDGQEGGTGGRNKDEDTNSDDKQKDDASLSTNTNGQNDDTTDGTEDKEQGDINESDENGDMEARNEDSAVSNGVWNLIEQYLQRRNDYLPHKQLQSHWTNINRLNLRQRLFSTRSSSSSCHRVTRTAR